MHTMVFIVIASLFVIIGSAFATSLLTALRNTILAALVTQAGSAAYCWVWTGSAPSKTANPTGTNLGLFALANPIGPGASAGALTLSAIANVTALASGTPGYYRITSGTVFTLSQAAISGTTVTYTGTITGGNSSAFANSLINISGFVNAGNNGTFVVTSSTISTLVVTNAAGVNEFHAATANMDNGTSVVVQGPSAVGSGDLDWASTIVSSGTIGITSWVFTEGDP